VEEFDTEGTDLTESGRISRGFDGLCLMGFLTLFATRYGVSHFAAFFFFFSIMCIVCLHFFNCKVVYFFNDLQFLLEWNIFTPTWGRLVTSYLTESLSLVDLQKVDLVDEL
jgi:hypothetical protein